MFERDTIRDPAGRILFILIKANNEFGLKCFLVLFEMCS